MIVAASLWEKKGERGGGLVRQYRPNITTNYIRITQIYQYIECVFQCSCFDYHSFITPVRSQVVLFGAGKMLRGLFECDLVRYVLLKQLANVCPSVLKGRCWVQHAFVPDFRFLPMSMPKNVSSIYPPTPRLFRGGGEKRCEDDV